MKKELSNNFISNNILFKRNKKILLNSIIFYDFNS